MGRQEYRALRHRLHLAKIGILSCAYDDTEMDTTRIYGPSRQVTCRSYVKDGASRSRRAVGRTERIQTREIIQKQNALFFF